MILFFIAQRYFVKGLLLTGGEMSHNRDVRLRRCGLRPDVRLRGSGNVESDCM